MKYIDIIKVNRRMADAGKGDNINAFLVSNITISKLKEIFECYHREAGVNLNASISSYDRVVQESFSFDGYKVVAILWEMQNFFDGLYQRLLFANKSEIDDTLENIKGQISSVLNNAKDVPLVLFNEFSAKPFTCGMDEGLIPLSEIADDLNQFVKNFNYNNVVIIKTDDIYCKLSLEKSVSHRDYFMAKSLYTVDFYKEYSLRAVAASRHLMGKGKKCIVFDCDNTLWGGVIGEDGLNGIHINSSSQKGLVFLEVRRLIRYLLERGVMVALCTKNNRTDIESVFNNHDEMMIDLDHFVSIKSNWNDKTDNLLEISYELNIGLDSIVFVDDSDYEINLIGEKLPDVFTMQVPDDIYSYPDKIRNLFPLFDLKSFTVEDASRNAKYKDEAIRRENKRNFGNINDYIDSLDIVVDIHFDRADDSSRLSQLTQKTNQFNTTTRRYGVSEVDLFIKSKDHKVLSINVRDRFGDYGLTGLVIFNANDARTLKIDTFLLSCRVLGRHVERAVVNFLIEYSIKKNIHEIQLEFIPSDKNHPVVDFFNVSNKIRKHSDSLYIIKCEQECLIESASVMVRK